MWWTRAHERKKYFFVTFIFSEGFFLNICALFQYIGYWINSQNVHTLACQKPLPHVPFYLFLKSSKAFGVSVNSLNMNEIWRRSLFSALNTFSKLIYPADIYLFKVNNSNTRTMSEICWKLTIETPERRHWSRCCSFISKFEQISYIVLVFLL